MATEENSAPEAALNADENFSPPTTAEVYDEVVARVSVIQETLNRIPRSRLAGRHDVYKFIDTAETHLGDAVAQLHKAAERLTQELTAAEYTAIGRSVMEESRREEQESSKLPTLDDLVGRLCAQIAVLECLQCHVREQGYGTAETVLETVTYALAVLGEELESAAWQLPSAEASS